jgi:AcrR family transcriptional regulator
MADRIDGRRLRYRHRRGELLDAAAGYVLECGVASLSLRRVAKAVGVSHVTLQHHFGTKEQLVGEIVEHLLERTFVPREAYPGGTPDQSMDLATRWRTVWAHLSSATGQRDLRLFVEVMGQSQYGGAGYAPAVKRSIGNRIDLLSRNMIALGCPEDEASTYATLAQAMLRGLAVDLLATGEHKRVNAAFERALETIVRRADEWGSSVAKRRRRQPVRASSELAG